MPRLFIVFRTYDTIWSCKTYTKEIAPFEFDKSNGDVKLMFTIDPISFDIPYIQALPKSDKDIYCYPNKNFKPCILNKNKTPHQPLCSTKILDNVNLRRYSLPLQPLSVRKRLPQCSVKEYSVKEENVFFVLPRYKCTIVLDAHLSSALSHELAESRRFRKRFLRYVKNNSGFRDCLSDYEQWTESEKTMWDNYLSVPFMIDVVTVWPLQKIDYPWYVSNFLVILILLLLL